MERMTDKQFKEWFNFKKDSWLIYQQACAARKYVDAAENYEKMKSEIEEAPLHSVFFADDAEYDPKRAAQLINDYEVELLNDLSENPQALIVWGSLSLELRTSLGPVKSYDREYYLHFSMLVAKALVELTTGQEKEAVNKGGKSATSLQRYKLNARGAQTLAIAKELAQKQVEEWESLHGYPSLYRIEEKVL